MDKKICLHCNIEKSFDEFRKYKNRDGSYNYRNVCKVCLRTQEKKSREKVNNVSTSKTTEQKKNIDYMTDLSTEQKKKLLKLLDNADLIIENINNKVDINVNEYKSKRTVKSFNIDNNLYEVIKKKSKSHDISISDLVNLIIRKGLEFFLISN